MKAKTLQLPFLILVVLVAPARAKEKKKFLTPGEMVKIMEKSKTQYKMDDIKSLKEIVPEKFADQYWPRNGKELEYPWISDDGKGNLSLQSYALDKECQAALDKTEPLFKDKKYEEAVASYQAAVDASPKCYFAFIGLGDCDFFTGEYARSLMAYQKAIDLDPYDFRGPFFKGHALLRMDRARDAKDDLIEALALKPRRESILKVLKAYAEALGVTVVDEPFVPRSLARLEGDTIAIYANPEDPPWLYHAICKGIWLGEPKHRKDLVDDEEHVWSTTEEKECLAALLAGYQQQRDDQKVAADPQMDRLERILEDGFLDEYAIYELGSRLSPDFALLLPAAEKARLKEFIGKYVVVPRGPSGGGKEDAKGGA